MNPEPPTFGQKLKTAIGYLFGSLPDGFPPQKQTKFLSPRYEPSNITQNTTAVQVQDAIRQAENGQTMDLFRFYRDYLLGDDHIQSESRTRKLAMLSQPMAVLPYDKNNPDDVLLSKAMIQAKDDCANWNDGMLALLDSHTVWPVSIVERLYQPQDDAARKRKGTIALNFTLKKFVPVNHQLECYQWAYLTGGVGLGVGSAIQLSQTDNTGAPARATGSENAEGRMQKENAEQDPRSAYTIDLERWEPYLKLWPIDAGGRIIYDVTRAEYLDPARHVVHRGHDLSAFRDNWGGPGRSILIPWLFRGLGREWFARGMERVGTPFPVAYTDINDPAQVQLLRDAFAFSRKIGGLVVSESSRIELQEAMVQGMAQGYETFYEMCNDIISKALTGKDSKNKAKGLNAGEDQMQQRVSEDYRMFDQMRMDETLFKQIAVPFRDLNGLGAGRVRFAWGGLSDADAKTFADLLVSMKNAGFTPTKESLPTVNERTGLTWEIATPTTPNADGRIQNEEDDTKTLSVGRLITFGGSRVEGRGVQTASHPFDSVIRGRITTLAEAYQNSMAPFRQAILESNSKADCLKKLSALYPDWSPKRLAAELDTALQIAAAAGAVEGPARKN